MIHAGELWAIIIAAVGLILTIMNIMDKAMVFRARAQEPDKKQDEEIAQLETGLKGLKQEVKEMGERYDEYFVKDRARLDNIESQAKRTNTVIIRSLQALTEHALNNNHIEQLEKSKEELAEYLLDR